MNAAMQLSTERLLLRDFGETDLQAVLEYQSDTRYQRFYAEEACTSEKTRELVLQFIQWAQEAPRTKFQLAIVAESEGRVIGTCGVRIAADGDREAEFGCALDPREWGQGYATEAARAIFAYAFGRLGLHRLWSRVIAENASAAALAQRLGMHLEGRLRRNCWMRGRWWDTLIYAVLEEEWRSGGGS